MNDKKLNPMLKESKKMSFKKLFGIGKFKDGLELKPTTRSSLKESCDPKPMDASYVIKGKLNVPMILKEFNKVMDYRKQNRS